MDNDLTKKQSSASPVSFDPGKVAKVITHSRTGEGTDAYYYGFSFVVDHDLGFKPKVEGSVSFRYGNNDSINYLPYIMIERVIANGVPEPSVISLAVQVENITDTQFTVRVGAFDDAGWQVLLGMNGHAWEFKFSCLKETVV